eukprot:6044624-Pleurochrysis_carterae.AAC.2
MQLHGSTAVNDRGFERTVEGRSGSQSWPTDGRPSRTATGSEPAPPLTASNTKVLNILMRLSALLGMRSSARS